MTRASAQLQYKQAHKTPLSFPKHFAPPNSHDNGLSNVKTLLTRCANDSTHLSLTVVSCFAGGTSKTAVDRPTTYYKR